MRLLKLRHRSAPASGNYPAVVVSLGIQDAYDLPGNVGCRIAEGSLKDPVVNAADLPSGASYDSTNHRVVLAGNYTGSRRTFSGWNLKGIAAYIEITRAGWTVVDCLCGPSKDNTGNLNVNNYSIKTSNTLASHTGGDANSNVIIEYCTVNGYDAGTDAYYNSAHIASTVDVSGVIVRRNRLFNSVADTINPRGDDWLVEYNHGTIGGLGEPAAHHDFLQILQGARLIVRRNYIDMTPSVSPAVISYGRTNAVRLEAFFGGSTVTDALVERNYIPGSNVVDQAGDPQFNIFASAFDGGTVSGNQFNYNALSTGTGVNVIHSGGDGATGTGNRKISDNTVISDFAL